MAAAVPGDPRNDAVNTECPQHLCQFGTGVFCALFMLHNLFMGSLGKCTKSRKRIDKGELILYKIITDYVVSIAILNST